MNALIVYDSAYGNTEQIAQAIGRGLEAGAEVKALQVTDVKPQHLTGLTLLVVGSPTQKFSPLPPITAFLKGIPANGLTGVRVAAFDTRMTPEEVERIRILAFFVRLFGYAAEPIAKRLQKKGGQPVAQPVGFFVGGTEGPLIDGELERATDWGRQLLP